MAQTNGNARPVIIFIQICPKVNDRDIIVQKP